MKKILFIALAVIAVVSAFIGVKQVLAHHNDWVITNTSEYGACVPDSNKCGVTTGKKTRTISYECQSVSGGSSDKCTITKTCNGTEYGGKCFESCISGQPGCSCFYGSCWKEKGYTYTPQTKTEDESITCTVPEEEVNSCEPSGECPTQCGLPASEVPDGEGGYKSCDATPVCETTTTTTTTEEHYDSPSQPSAPVCSDGNTLKLPANPHVLRAGSDATVNWFETEGDEANIYFKEVGASDWTHAVRDIKASNNPEHYVSYTIHDLDPNLGYVFGIQQKHGCGGGETVIAVIVDGPETQLFPFSYWEWAK